MSVAYQDPKHPYFVIRPGGGTMSRRMAERAGYSIVPHPTSGIKHPARPVTAAPAVKILSAADENRIVAAGMTRAFQRAVMALPEAATRPAAAAKLASMEVFTPEAVAVESFTFTPQLDRARGFLRGLPAELTVVEAPVAAKAEGPSLETRMRTTVRARMATLPATKEGHRLRYRLGKVLVDVNEGRSVRSALVSHGFDPAAYEPR